MISKLPRWAWIGSALLAGFAGIINTVGFLSFQHQGITHLTGSTTLLGIAIAGGSLTAVLHLAAVIAAFMAGCIASGALVKDSALQLGRRYGVALALESLLLFCAVPLMERFQVAGIYLASCACGLQNGMVSTYSGAVFRTTHVSGLFTDLGIFIGQALRGLKVDRRRIKLSVVLIGSFLTGTAVGAVGFAHFDCRVLYFPATALGIVGLTYYLLYRQDRPA
ncbi:MAG: YoaK family protein [Opitutaceae bacterium]